MKITKFEFEDLRTKWHLEEASFDPFNLLVGVSGVGKTKILEALRRVCRLATEGDYGPGHVEWLIEFEESGLHYRWEGNTEPVTGDIFPVDTNNSSSMEDVGRPTEIAREKIALDDHTIIIDRTQETFKFQGDNVPKLKKAVSAIVLLESEEQIAPIQRGFNRLLFSAALELNVHAFESYSLQQIEKRVDEYRHLQGSRDGFDTFRNILAAAGLSVLSRYIPLAAYYLQETFTDEFAVLRDSFLSIFPSVRDVKVHRTSKPRLGSGVQLELNIQEEGTDAWIPQSEMSSGMLRVLLHLIELSLAPSGSVIIIDEFENSLGKNCMPQLTDFIMSRAPDLQFFITSHHPYVINKIPIDTWKLVQRRGGRVRVVSARDIPALQAASHHDAFDRLLNLPEFEEGIA